MEVEINEIPSEVPHFPLEYHQFPILNSDVPYSEFFENCFLKNQACLIQNVTNNWKSSRFWVENRNANFFHLEKEYGDLSVTVIDCKGEIDYNNKKPLKWMFRDYIDYWKNYNAKSSTSMFYLKDWHLKNKVPQDNFYEVPLYFACDWLNEYLVEDSLDDYRFVYMGVQGTWSPFHVDVMTSYSWSSNICGQKKWVLFPPGEEEHLRDSLGNLPNDITTIKHNRKCFEVIQNSNDAIFVPSNWHHQVWNIKDTISINHNWINGCNLHLIWKSMEKNLEEIKKEIADCNDMENFLDHCQIMLKASFSLNFEEFFKIIKHVASKRLRFLKGGPKIQLTEQFVLGKNHALFDLGAIKSSLIKLINYPDLNDLSYFKRLTETPMHLLDDIENNT